MRLSTRKYKWVEDGILPISGGHATTVRIDSRKNVWARDGYAKDYDEPYTLWKQRWYVIVKDDFSVYGSHDVLNHNEKARLLGLSE